LVIKCLTKINFLVLNNNATGSDFFSDCRD
jgi:hypothetical protein